MVFNTNFNSCYLHFAKLLVIILILIINYFLALELLNWIQSLKNHGITKELHFIIKLDALNSYFY